MHGLSAPEASGLDITPLDGELGAVVDPTGSTATATDSCVCWPACIFCTVAPLDE